MTMWAYFAALCARATRAAQFRSNGSIWRRGIGRATEARLLQLVPSSSTSFKLETKTVERLDRSANELAGTASCVPLAGRRESRPSCASERAAVAFNFTALPARRPGSRPEKSNILVGEWVAGAEQTGRRRVRLVEFRCAPGKTPGSSIELDCAGIESRG